MSLINDALKRAKEAQQQSTESHLPAPMLLPAPPPDKMVRGVGLMVQGLFFAVALLILFLVWQLAQSRNRAQAAVEPASLGLSSGSALTGNGSRPDPTTPPAAPMAAPVAPEAPGSPAVVAESPTPAVAVAAPVPTNPVPAVVVAPTNEPAPLKLHSVVMHPTHPSAMVNGRFLRVGDRLGEFRLTAVTKNTATLVSRSATNVLHLEE